MVIPLENLGMTPKRNRIVRSFSFRPEAEALFARARERVKAYLPGVNDSELVRVGLEVLMRSPDEILRRVAGAFERVERGRPLALIPPSSGWEDELLEEDQGRQKRVTLFEELEMLREGSRGEPAVEARIETLCRYFGMVYRQSRLK